MAFTSVVNKADMFGVTWTFYNDAGTVKFYSSLAPATILTGPAMPSASTAFDVMFGTDDLWEIVYLTAGGAVATFQSDDNGGTWT